MPEKHGDLRRRQVLSPGFSGHYQDLGTTSLTWHDSACNCIRSVARLTLLWALAPYACRTMTMLYWRIFHFFIMHRMMHPWWNRKGDSSALSTAETCPCTYFISAEILVLAGGTIPPAPAVPASTRISVRLKSV